MTCLLLPESKLDKCRNCRCYLLGYRLLILPIESFLLAMEEETRDGECNLGYEYKVGSEVGGDVSDRFFSLVRCNEVDVTDEIWLVSILL